MESGCCIDLCHPFTTLGTHVTWASAPTLRVVFASSKETQKRPPDKGLVSTGPHGAVANLLRVSGVIGRRHRITIAPLSALLTRKISRNIPRSAD
ncbi:hypothetical protein Dace_0411 [Desulfuromonas acetoxidans DSM 684]|uniref:Uncharacterized protein n=1 Tax=Desulfuromonas acetoxidans (strain DSM 684 / 11070) TaxID=281689 RepID=Q1JWI6_DESA6|nr:hypothetical protein Dace_0411 [Desulfuromonas acetoxidans DSM 684]